MFIQKLQGLFWRLLYYIKDLPLRCQRLVQHIKDGFAAFEKEPSVTNRPALSLALFSKWCFHTFLLILDLLGIGELYQSLMDFIKPKTRPLKDWELELAREYFGDQLKYNIIRIDESARIATKQRKICYVSFHTINSWGAMTNATFVHELIHIWQYENMGSLYIPKALSAQKSAMGYNYGGITRLEQFFKKGLKAFNLEQQGDIISDHYRIKNNLPPRWGIATFEHLPLYERYVNEIRNV